MCDVVVKEMEEEAMSIQVTKILRLSIKYGRALF
jgi:hypothetical protein